MLARRKPLRVKSATQAEREWAQVTCVSGVCLRCGNLGRVHPHHIIPRRYRAFRTDRRNGIPLCFTCHVGGPKSAHGSPLDFRKWLWDALPGKMERLHAECPEAMLRKEMD